MSPSSYQLQKSWRESSFREWKCPRGLLALAVKWLDRLHSCTAILRSVTISFLCFTTNCVLVLFLVLCDVSVHVFVHIHIQAKNSNRTTMRTFLNCMLVARSFIAGRAGYMLAGGVFGQQVHHHPCPYLQTPTPLHAHCLTNVKILGKHVLPCNILCDSIIVRGRVALPLQSYLLLVGHDLCDSCLHLSRLLLSFTVLASRFIYPYNAYTWTHSYISQFFSGNGCTIWSKHLQLHEVLVLMDAPFDQSAFSST